MCLRMYSTILNLLLITCHITLSEAKMLRNDALISKMVSDFHKENGSPIEPRPSDFTQPKNNVLSMMQSVLCRNFPTIPCEMITEDETLKKLIEKSIQQLKYKKLSMDRTTPSPGRHLTLFPVLNSEDLSNFLQVSDTGFYKYKQEKGVLRKHSKKSKIVNSNENTQKYMSKGDSQRSPIYGRKKIRKFYPHKIKYKDKRSKVVRKEFDNSDDKLSMSVEAPDLLDVGKHLTYRVEPSDPPVWRIDYMKHGDPSLTRYSYEPDTLQTKLIKTGPNVMLDDNLMEPRKDVLHPDVYIKKNFVRKNTVDSGGLD